MALSKKPANTEAAAPAATTAVADKPTAAAPQFEAEDEVPAQEASPEERERAQEVATTAIAVVRKGGAVTKISNDTTLRGLQDVIGIDALETLGIGVFPRITIGLDGFSIDKSEDLGKEIKIEVLSWNHLTLVSPGEQEDAEANKKVRTSYDGVNLKGGEGLVTDYVAALKEEGYDKASAKKYIEIYCHLVESEEKGAVAPEDQKIHQLSLSPQSAGRWQAYLLQAGVNKSRGIGDSAVVVVRQEKRLVNNKKFGVGAFSAR